jgi:predicted CxxxxCH...CXXCH cytochrome family protein
VIVRATAILIILLIILAARAGATSRAQPDPIDQGAHRAHAADTPSHTAYRCETCHSGGGTVVTIDGWNAASKSCAVYCHGGFAGGRPSTVQWTAAAARLTCVACHGYPPATKAHVTHAGREGYGMRCAVCHGPTTDWLRRHTGGAVFIALDPRAGIDAAYGNGSCANVVCHSNGRGTPRTVTWDADKLSCASCHDDETTAAPQMSGQHARHFRIGVACADCHGSVVDRSKQIADRTLHVNGTVDVKVLAGRYSAGICAPACHEPRAW